MLKPAFVTFEVFDLFNLKQAIETLIQCRSRLCSNIKSQCHESRHRWLRLEATRFALDLRFQLPFERKSLFECRGISFRSLERSVACCRGCYPGVRIARFRFIDLSNRDLSRSLSRLMSCVIFFADSFYHDLQELLRILLLSAYAGLESYFQHPNEVLRRYRLSVERPLV